VGPTNNTFSSLTTEQDEKEWILSAILEIFEKIRDLVTLDNFICDFAVINRDGQKRVMVIELNPWLDTTDACLFSWWRDDELV
jgi:hypothetical protein